MNASRMKAERHWKSVGAAVAKMGNLVTAAMTGKPIIDSWIREGYENQKGKQASLDSKTTGKG